MNQRRVAQVSREMLRSVSIVAAAGFMLLAAQSGALAKTMAELYEGAKKEGTITVFGPPNVTVRTELTDGFSKAYPGIAVEYSGLRTFQIDTKLAAEARAGIYSVDVIISGPTTAAAFRGPFEHLLVDPDAKDQSKWRSGKFIWADTPKTLLAMVWQSMPPVLVNTDIVKPGEIKSDMDLLNPKWKGRIIAGTPMVPGASHLTYRRLFDTHGEDFIRKLSAQDIAITRDYREQTDAVAKGKYAIGLGASATISSQFFEKGVKNIAFLGSAVWKEPLYYSPGFGTLIVPQRRAHENSSALFVNWLLTKDGQTRLSKGMALPSNRLDVPDDHTLEVIRYIEGKNYVYAFDEAFYASPQDAKLEELLKTLDYRK